MKMRLVGLILLAILLGTLYLYTKTEDRPIGTAKPAAGAHNPMQDALRGLK